MELPAGAVGFAWGAEFRKESLDARTSAQVLSGTELRPAINVVNGERQVSAAYAELSVPLHRTLELQVAGRGDHYDDFGNAFSPKVALRWQPLDSLLLRGSFSRGFRAPSLPEIAPGQTVSYGSVIDRLDPLQPGGSRGVTNIRTGNPDLKAERSRNFNVGAVWSPDGDTSIGLDWYRIEQDNLVKPDSAQFIVDNPTLFTGRVQRDAQGRIQFITNQYANQGELTTSGLDWKPTAPSAPKAGATSPWPAAGPICSASSSRWWPVRHRMKGPATTATAHCRAPAALRR